MTTKEHGTVTNGPCHCGRQVELAGWLGEPSQDSALYLHVDPVDPDFPERCFWGNEWETSDILLENP